MLDAARSRDGGGRSPLVYCGLRGWQGDAGFLAGYEVDLRAVLESAGMREVGEG
jgi:hypothetical protein